MIVFAGGSSEALTDAICTELGVSVGRRLLSRHNDGSPRTQLHERVRREIVVIVQSLFPMDRAWVELIAMIDAATRASASEIWVVMPYFAGRQDKGDEPRVDITAAWSLRMLESLVVDRIFSLDLHSGQIRGFVGIPFDHLTVLPLLLEHLVKEKRVSIAEASIVSPDAGGVKRARKLTHDCGASNMVIIDKERLAPGRNRAHTVIGDPAPVSIIVDDIADTLGTLCEAAAALKANGVEHVYAAVTHAVLGGNALENLRLSKALDHLVVSDTIPASPEALATGKVSVVSTARVIAEVLRRIHSGESLQEMNEGVVGHTV